MVLIVCSVLDVKAKAFLQPFFVANSSMAIRSFGDAVNNAKPDNNFYQHPEHFRLYQLGTFDDETGLHTLLDAPEFVVDAVSLMRTSGG